MLSAISFCGELVTKVESYELQFTPEKEAAELICNFTRNLQP
jgi:hypothetical protein